MSEDKHKAYKQLEGYHQRFPNNPHIDAVAILSEMQEGNALIQQLVKALHNVITFAKFDGMTGKFSYEDAIKVIGKANQYLTKE